MEQCSGVCRKKEIKLCQMKGTKFNIKSGTLHLIANAVQHPRPEAANGNG
jgi:hypothetical protein